PPVEQLQQPNELDMPPPPGSEPQESKEKKDADGEGEKKTTRERAILAVEDSGEDSSDGEDMESPPEDVLVFSAREMLRKKDFAQFTSEEIAEARRIIDTMTWRLGTRKTRRREKAVHGEFIDYRRTLRHSLKHGG